MGKKAEKIVETAVEPVVDNDAPVVSTGLGEEIEGAVTGVVEIAEAAKKAAEVPLTEEEIAAADADAAEAAEASEAPAVKVEKLIKAEAAEISDDLVERAVRAGISMKDAREFKTPEVLARMCERFEVKPVEENVEADEQEKGIDDILSTVPELDPDVYDEKIVATVKVLKDIARNQDALITKLRNEGNARGETPIDSRLDALGKPYADAAPAGSEARTALEAKFKVLQAGYKAAKADISDEVAFGEAAKIVLGNVDADSREEKRAAALKDRTKLHIAKPLGTSTKSSGDVLADVAAQVDAKFKKD